MIPLIWTKPVIAIFHMHSSDVADTFQPLPFITQLSWNHYIGFYKQSIINYFHTFIPFPFISQSFWIQFHQNHLTGTEIIGNLVSLYQHTLQQPLHFICHFRSNNSNIIDLEKHYKNSLKSSTALRYGKYGAKMLTVDMSVNNVKNMFISFMNNHLESFLGSNDFQSSDLGYKFLIHKSQSMPIRIVSHQYTIERKYDINLTLNQFLAQLFNKKQNIYQIYPLYLHGVILKKGDIILKDLQKYCHPDGYLYLTHREVI